MKVVVHHSISGGALLRQVFKFEADRWADDAVTLEEIFRELNIGDGLLARAYRARALRSMSVGDVVEIDDRRYACDHLGWRELSSVGGE